MLLSGAVRRGNREVELWTGLLLSGASRGGGEEEAELRTNTVFMPDFTDDAGLAGSSVFDVASITDSPDLGWIGG